MCNIDLDGLPFTVIAQIIPELFIASLLSICVLTEAGCSVLFDKHKCVVHYSGKIILEGKKHLDTDLWTLPLGSQTNMSSSHDYAMTLLSAPESASTHTCPETT
jgi:hypothetical protein